MDYISTMLGTYISGPMFENVGYYAVFGTSLGLAALGVIYMLVFVKESKQNPKVSNKTTQYGTEQSNGELCSCHACRNKIQVTAFFCCYTVTVLMKFFAVQSQHMNTMIHAA